MINMRIHLPMRVNLNIKTDMNQNTYGSDFPPERHSSSVEGALPCFAAQQPQWDPFGQQQAATAAAQPQQQQWDPFGQQQQNEQQQQQSGGRPSSTFYI